VALFDAFLKLDGIKGESADAKHKGEIDILSFSWGVQQTGTSASGGGGGSGKVKFHDLQITKKTDAASPLLMLNCANGAHLKEASLTVRKAGGEQLEYLKIKLTDVLVSSYQPSAVAQTIDWGDSEAITGNTMAMGAAGGASQSSGQGVKTTSGGGAGDEIPMESITLNFAKVEVAYQPQGADGKAQGGPILAGWDVKHNVKV
jgi:type VI secretion system secreted protein Hcp